MAQLFKCMIKGVKVRIPSNLYPLSNQKEMKIFTHSNTESFNLTPEMIQYIDTYNNFKMGHCYSNSQILEEKALELNLDAKLYSGWILLGQDEHPVHHAWVVFDDKHLVDVSLSTFEDYAMRDAIRVLDEMKKEGREPVNVRQFMVKHTKRLKREKGDMKKSEDIVIGKVPEPIIYVGSPDTADNAAEIYLNLRKKYPQHPTYRNMGGRIIGMTETQRLMKESGWK